MQHKHQSKDFDVDSKMEMQRNLTLWVGDNWLTFSMAKVTVRKVLNKEMHYYIVDSITECGKSEDILGLGQLEIVFNHARYVEFGKRPEFWQFINATYTYRDEE